MKKVLFATTALIATAGMAAADVKLGGYGRFGLDYNEANKTVVGRSDTNITSRLRLQIDMSTETDNGIGFNARVRMQSESRDGNPGVDTGLAGDDNGFNGARFGVTFGGLMVNVGNIIGAVENAPGLYLTGTKSAGTGVDGMGYHSLPIKAAGGGTSFAWDAYSSSGMGANGVEALYSAGGFTGHISYSQRNGGAVAGTAGGESRLGVMGTYSFGDYYISAAMQDSDVAANDITFAAIGGDFGQFGGKISYGSTDGADSFTVEGNMDLGAASYLVAWVNNADYTAPGVALDGTSYGISYSYDLGGGASFEAGWVESADDITQVQAGVFFSF